MASFEIQAMVRGYHIYKDVWSAVIDEEFPCKREGGNRSAVSIASLIRSKKDFIRLFAIYSSRWRDPLPCDRL